MKAFFEPTKYDFHLTMDNPLKVMYMLSPAGTYDAMPDMHYALHLGILLSGKMESVYEDFRVERNPGDFWFTAPWEPHATGRKGFALEILLITILPEKLGDIGFSKGINWLLPFIVPPSERPRIVSQKMRKEVLRLAGEIKSAESRKDKFGGINCWLKTHELLLTIIDESGFTERPEVKMQNMALERILPAVKMAREAKENLVLLGDAARACHLGKSRFSDLFKTAMGTTFGKFSNRVRIGAAAAEIAKNNLPVKEIANSWGFYDESHFCRVFRKYFHCSPNEFRQKNPSR
jgi:AraC-like DNA-binding protein